MFEDIFLEVIKYIGRIPYSASFCIIALLFLVAFHYLTGINVIQL